MMPVAQKLMIFDLDGTLVDTAADLTDALNVSLANQGFPRADAAAARTWIGHGARQMIRNALEQLNLSQDDNRVAAMFKDFLTHYEANISRHSRPYPSLIDALDVLDRAGWSFAVCSNKQEQYCRQLLDELGMSNRFLVIAGGDTFPVSKPHADHLLCTIETARGVRDRSIMVGDASTDIEAARAAGLPVIGVTFGYSPVPMSQLAPDVLLDHYSDLTPMLAESLLIGPDLLSPLE